MLVFKTTWRLLEDMSWRHVLKTFSKRLQYDNFSSSKTSWRRLVKTSWRRLENILEEKKLLCWRRLEDMSSKRLDDMSSKRLQDVLETNKMLTGNISSVSKKSKSVSDKSTSHISISDKSRRIQNASSTR